MNLAGHVLIQLIDLFHREIQDWQSSNKTKKFFLRLFDDFLLMFVEEISLFCHERLHGNLYSSGCGFCPHLRELMYIGPDNVSLCVYFRL